MTIQQFREKIQKEIEENPFLEEEILDFYQLALDEIENGASVEHEMSLCVESINQLKREE